MNARIAILLLVLVPFALFSAGVVVTQGVASVFDLAAREPWALQISLDLCISLGLVLLWIYRDTRESGGTFLPYLLLTLCTGSIGALVYLLRREHRRHAPATS